MRILFLQKRILFPADVGMKIRTLNVVRHLARRHEIVYLCNVRPEDEPYLDEMRNLGVHLVAVPWHEAPRGSLRFSIDVLRNVFSPYPFSVDKDYDPALRRRAEELLSTKAFDLVICDFVQMARNAVGLPAPASLLFQHNVEAEVLERQASSGNAAHRAFLKLQARKMRRFEGDAGRRFDRVVAVSERDRARFEREYGWSHVRTIDTAVDTDHFRPTDGSNVPGRCVFVGSMDWHPNQEGIRWFIERVWPQVRSSRPDATFQVVGRNPPASLERLGRTPGVEVTGTVPDVRPHLAEADAVLVPLLSGGGTRLKIYEAMAMQKAVVSTTLGAEGLPVTDREHLLVADDADAFSAAVVEVLNDRRLRDRLADAAYRLVTKDFSAETVAEGFETICIEAVQSAASRGAALSCAE